MVKSYSLDHLLGDKMERRDNIFVITAPLSFNKETMHTLLQQLITVENTPGPKAIVFTGPKENIF